MSGDTSSNSYRQRDIKKSKFIEKEASGLADNDYFDLVKDNQNFKVKLSEMVTKFGTTGSLEQKGEVTGVPVLNQVGTVNQIRNIVPISGITGALSSEGGVQLDHNFTVDKTGVPVMSNETAASPTIRSIVAGTGISVAATNGGVQIALSSTPTTTKTVIINSEADFPTAVANVITLDSDTQYFITNDITTTSRFILGEDTVVTGADGTLITLESTNTGVMFSSTNASNKIKDIICVCSSGTFIDITGSVGDEIFQIVSSRVVCGTIGTIDTVFTTSFQNVAWEVTTDGLTFLNNNSIISFFQNIGGISAGTFVDLGTSTFDGFSFSNSFGVVGAGATFLSGAVDSGNVNTGGLGVVLNTRALGSGTALSGIDEKDSLWEFLGNSGIKDSRNTLLATNAGATVTIAVANTPVIIGATWVMEEESRFAGVVGGRFTYNGTGAFISLHATISASIATATDDCTFYFFKNGTEITNSGVQRTLSAGTNANLSLLWGDELETGDYIEIHAENNDGTVNILVDNVIVRFD